MSDPENMQRRLALVKVDADVLGSIVRDGWGEFHSRFVTDAPKDLELVDIRSGPPWFGGLWVEFLCRSKDFEPVPFGSIPPQLEVKFTRETCGCAPHEPVQELVRESIYPDPGS